MSVSYDDKRVWQNIHPDLKDGLLVRTLSLLECLVCSEVMHVPYLAVCGHSFCYGCLDAWFETKVNCPTCRKDMVEPPVLNIQLREISKAITDLVIDTLEDEKHRTELREARGRLVDEHDHAARAQGLFRDAFNSAPTLVDRSDGVPRCGNCHWEAHGSVCLHCGARFRTPRGDLYFDSEDGDAYNEDEDEVEMYGIDAANYDSDDSFVDSRDVHEINNDRERHASDGLLSSGDELSATELWSGFRQDAAMYRSPDQGATPVREPLRAVSVLLSSSRSRSSVGAGLDLLYGDAQFVGYLDDGELYDDMEHAVDALHSQDLGGRDEGSESDWDAGVPLGSRRHIVYLDSE